MCQGSMSSVKMTNAYLWFCPSLTSPGEWQTQFDPLVTSKGVFYLDNQNSVSVDMMKSAQYPLRLLDDHELKAQVQQVSDKMRLRYRFS